MFLFFFFNDTATTEIYTLSLHDALPIYFKGGAGFVVARKRFSFPPPEAYTFTFDVHGVAPANKLEFKLVDPSGHNVWRYQEDGFGFPAERRLPRTPDRPGGFLRGTPGSGPLR